MLNDRKEISRSTTVIDIIHPTIVQVLFFLYRTKARRDLTTVNDSTMDAELRLFLASLL